MGAAGTLAVIFVIAGTAADIITTYIGIHSWGLREDNPLVRFLMRKLGNHWWLPKVGLAVLSIGAMSWVHDANELEYYVAAVVLNAAAGAALGGVAVWNFLQIKRQM